jgi:hypothetical protein
MCHIDLPCLECDSSLCPSYPHYIHYSRVSHFITISVIKSNVGVSQCLWPGKTFQSTRVVILAILLQSIIIIILLLLVIVVNLLLCLIYKLNLRCVYIRKTQYIGLILSEVSGIPMGLRCVPCI